MTKPLTRKQVTAVVERVDKLEEAIKWYQHQLAEARARIKELEARWHQACTHDAGLEADR